MATSIHAAAESCGSNGTYVQAAATLLKAENAELVRRVLDGKVPILTAAAQSKRVAAIVAAYRSADDASRVAAARVLGIDPLLNMLAEAAE